MDGHLIPYTEPAVRRWEHGLAGNVEVYVLEEYSNHPTISGNKWWKLHDNLQHAKRVGANAILTFGGAYSNHIYATAAATAALGMKSIGVIRGEQVSNPTLEFASKQGMTLHFVTREWYRSKNEEKSLLELGSRFGDFYLVPEGGSNDLAVASCARWGRKIAYLPYDEVWLPVGTGGTMAGLICGINDTKDVVGVPVLRNDGFVDKAIEEFVARQGVQRSRWRLLNNFHQGGYAKTTPELLEFCAMIKTQGFIVEPVYTGKLFFALYESIRQRNVHAGSRVLLIHTGGLQTIK